MMPAHPAPEQADPTLPAEAHPTTARGRRRPRGQVLVIFALSIFVLLGICAVVVDVSWYWANTLRVQRAADAGALAGVVDLPGQVTLAESTAAVGVEQNGYSLMTVSCSGGDQPTSVPGVCAYPDPNNDRQLDVTLSEPVNTFFMRLIGINKITATRTANALYVLPVPMGSPENYYGSFGQVRTESSVAGPYFARTSGDGLGGGDDQWSSVPSGDTRVQDLQSPNDGEYATAASTSKIEWLGTFGFNDFPSGATFSGIKVLMRGLGNNTTGCSVKVALSYDNGKDWTSNSGLKTQTLTATNTLYTLGSDTDLWNYSGWNTTTLSDNHFLVSLQPATLSGACTLIEIDQVQVEVVYTYSNTMTGPGAACPSAAANCLQDVGGQTLNTRGFWATMDTDGASNVNGDAYQPYYDNPTSTPAKTCPSPGNACYDPIDYYNYAFFMPAGTTGGYVYIYDPAFCATALNEGLGDRWFSGSGPVSTWFELYNTNDTPYNLADDTPIATSGNLFQDMNGSDTLMGGPTGGGYSTCIKDGTVYGDYRDYHDAWYLLNPGQPLSGAEPNGTTYRVHTTQSLPPQFGTYTYSDPDDQKNANGENSFAIFGVDNEGTTTNGLLPQVYGLGAMQMFTPLSASGSLVNSDFYLAQVDQAYAGRTLEIKLWDPGDTSPLSATLYILEPTSSGWSYADFTYTAHTGTTGGANSACNTNSNSSPTNDSVQTSTGAATGLFNGCWLTMEVPIPTNYTAPQSGWWKIEYAMNGNGTSSDVTTWTADIKGNPVHLVVP